MKDHQKSNNSRSGVDDELPRVEKSNSGPVISHPTIRKTANAKAQELPVQ
jgi:hypothetical protein